MVGRFPFRELSMFAKPAKLSQKIVGTLLVFFLIATAAIGLTLSISWQLEGVAAAINDAGSQRMRSYRIGHLMARNLEQSAAADSRDATLAAEMARFDRVLNDLHQGDADRPLAAPRNMEVRHLLDAVETDWRSHVRPLVMAYQGATRESRQRILENFDAELEGFVTRIDKLVMAMERSYASDTDTLRTLQGGLMVLALIGTVLLISYFVRLVIRPVNVLHEGMRRMSGNDLSVRLPVTSDDELGSLADGFNQMAEHLQAVYSTLEERVEAETRSLAERNRELGILYEVTAFLGEQAPLDVLCQGFLHRIKSALAADAGAVRLYVPQTEKLHLVASEDLSAAFLTAEAELNCGECLCGEVIQTGLPARFDTAHPPPGMKLRTCVREGFATATAFSILYDKQKLGVFNLYFRHAQALSVQEMHLLETLGLHLGVAIESQRLKSREKELAVSEERNLLAQELHDSIAQGLAFLNIQVQLLQDSLKKNKLDEALHTAAELREGVQESYDDVRELLVHFRTRMNQADLDTAIRNALQKFEGQTGIETAFESRGGGVPIAPSDEIQVMHIVQESLSNIRKHARAARVEVVVDRRRSGLEVVVADDGEGFDTINEPRLHSDRHVGLQIMRERAHRIGGECRVESRIGEGTRVTLALPRENGGEV